MAHHCSCKEGKYHGCYCYSYGWNQASCKSSKDYCWSKQMLPYVGEIYTEKPASGLPALEYPGEAEVADCNNCRHKFSCLTDPCIRKSYCPIRPHESK